MGHRRILGYCLISTPILSLVGAYIYGNSFIEFAATLSVSIVAYTIVHLGIHLTT